MRKLFAIGTLLLSSAAVMVTPAAAADRNYVNNQNYSHTYVAPAPAPAHAPVVSFNVRAQVDRGAQIRLDQRIREERLERERLERARVNVRYTRSLRDGC